LPAPPGSKVVIARYRSLNDTAESTSAKDFTHISVLRGSFSLLNFEPGRPPDIPPVALLAESGAQQITI
jgi:hypothetical protein